MKKNYLKKRVMSLLLALVMMLCVTLSAGATEAPSSTPEGEIKLGENDFIVPEAAAAYIAVLFVEDMAGSGNTKWNSETKAVNTVVMYDETGLAPSAYAVELTEGYVVVSAYADVPSLILEWADDGEPVYSEAPLEADEDIIYTSPLDYYVTDGETVETFQGEEVDAEEIPTPLQDCRSEENVNPDLRENIAEEKAAWLEEHPLAAYAGTNGQKGDYITDVFKYAQNAYNSIGEWKCIDWKNYWDSYTSNMIIDSNVAANNPNACGVIGATNLIRMYGNKYSTSSAQSIKKQSTLSIFNNIVDMTYKGGIAGLQSFRYYTRDPRPGIGGVLPDMAGPYARDAFAKYNVNITVSNIMPITEAKTKSTLSSNNKLMLLTLFSQSSTDAGKPYQPYGHHIVVGYAYTTLSNKWLSEDLSFIKILDGQFTGNRFIDLELIGNSMYFEVAF